MKGKEEKEKNKMWEGQKKEGAWEVMRKREKCMDGCGGGRQG